MGKVTKISWATSSHNFWYGCQKVSPECAYCYAERWAKRTGRDFANVTRVKDFTAPLRWPEPKVIFTCSLSDFFVKEADAWREEAWEVIRKAYWHTWLILSKRWSRVIPEADIPWVKEKTAPWPHVVLGASAGNQRMLDWQLPLMHRVPAARYFLSAEPLLGPIDLSKWMDACAYGHRPERAKVDCVIVGGESGGPEYRRLVRPHECAAALRRDCLFDGHKWEPKPTALQWVRSIRDQCADAGVTFHLKQWGGPKPDSGGAMLDGREWRQFPGK